MDKQNDKRRDEEKEEIKQDSQESEGHIENQAIVSREEFDALKDLATQMESLYKRAIADYQNLQRRTQEQKTEWIKSANRDLILKMLPVLDTLMLAQKHIQDKGLSLSIDQFLLLLEQEGVKKIETVGKEFDPHLMEAIGTTEGEDGKVLEEVRAGFIMYESVLRSAQVIVGKGEQ